MSSLEVGQSQVQFLMSIVQESSTKTSSHLYLLLFSLRVTLINTIILLRKTINLILILLQ
jgi:hypothetical protein